METPHAPPGAAAPGPRSVRDGFFIAANGLDMLIRGLEARAHRVDRDVCGPQFLPCLCLANPFVEAAIAYGQPRFDADCSGIAAYFSNIAAQSFERLAHLLVGIALWEPAIAQARHAPQQNVGASTQPDRNGAAHRQWI